MSSDNNVTSEEQPPVFKNWSGWYWLVILVMLVQLALYSWISFSYA